MTEPSPLDLPPDDDLDDLPEEELPVPFYSARGAQPEMVTRCRRQ